MKRNPTRIEKEQIKEAGLVPNNWLTIKQEIDSFTIKHKKTGTTRVIKKQ